MQRIIFVTFVLLLAFLNPAHSAVVPSYEGWEAAEEEQVRVVVNAFLRAEAVRPAHYIDRTITLTIRASAIGQGSYYSAGALYIGTRPYAGTENEWFNHSLVHEISHALTDFTEDAYVYLPSELFEALAETYTQYIASKHLQSFIAPPRGRLAGIRQRFGFLPEKPDIAFRETAWQQSETHSCVFGDCESYPELAFVLYRLVSAAATQMQVEDWEVFYMLTRSLHEQWQLNNRRVLHYPAIYAALNRAFSGVSIDNLSPGDWLATRRTFSQLKTGKLSSIEAVGSYWDGARLKIGPFNPSVWRLRLLEGVAPRHIQNPVQPVPATGGQYRIVVENAFGNQVFATEVQIAEEDKGQASGQLPQIEESGLYQISAYMAGNAEHAARGYFMVFDSLGDELVSNSRFVWSISPHGDINSQPPQVTGCHTTWSVAGLSKLDDCAGPKVYVSGQEFSLDTKRRILVTNSASRWPVLKPDPSSVLLSRTGESTKVSVHNTNPLAFDASFRTRVTHDSGTLDLNWCSATQAQGQVTISASPRGNQYLRQCQVCFESTLGSSTACVNVTYNPFNN